MSRQLRALLSLVLVSIALGAAACAGSAGVTGPQPQTCDVNGSNTCQPH